MVLVWTIASRVNSDLSKKKSQIKPDGRVARTSVLTLPSRVPRPCSAWAGAWVASLLAPQIKGFLHLLAVVGIGPLFGVMVGVEHRDHHVMHVTRLRALETGRIQEIKGDGF